MMEKLKNNKPLKITFSVFKTLLTVFLLLLICIIFTQKVSNNNVAIAGIRAFTIISGSMLPEYEIGDMVISKEVAYDSINIGDNIVYNGLKDDFNGKIVTHQVVDKYEKDGKKFLLTKGINNPIEDPEIEESQVIGKVIYKTIILSFISKAINNTTSFFFIVFIPFSILIFFEIYDVIKERKENE